jgi:hypothetical protein
VNKPKKPKPYSLKQDARDCMVRAKLYPVVIGTEKVTKKEFMKRVRQFRKRKLYGE